MGQSQRGDLVSAAVGWLAAVLDAVTTRLALAGGGRELNPLAKEVMRGIGVGETLMLGLAVRAAIVLGLAALTRTREPHARSAAAVLLIVIAVWWLAVDTRNVAALL